MLLDRKMTISTKRLMNIKCKIKVQCPTIYIISRIADATESFYLVYFPCYCTLLLKQFFRLNTLVSTYTDSSYFTFHFAHVIYSQRGIIPFKLNIIKHLSKLVNNS